MTRFGELDYPCGDPPAIGGAREIAAGVHWVRLPMPFALDHVNSWVLTSEGGFVIVDTGLADDRTARCWQGLLGAEGPFARRERLSVWVTHLHPDHVGMAGDLVRGHGASLSMTSKEYDAAVSAVAKSDAVDPQRIEFLVRAGWTPEDAAHGGRLAAGFATSVSALPAAYAPLSEETRIRAAGTDWEVITGSGHSPQHACFYSAEKGMLISGDQVLPRISSNVSVFSEAPDANPLADWLASIAKFRARLPAGTLVLPAHNEPFRGLHARLDRLEQDQHRALDRLRAALTTPMTAVDAITPLFRRAITDPLQLEMATGESLACLNYLLARGEIEVHDDSAGIARYRIREVSRGRRFDVRAQASPT